MTKAADVQTLLDVILPVFLVIGFGYVAVWAKLFPASGIDGVMKFTQNFAIPCLLFQAIAHLDLSASLTPALMVSFFGGAAICFALGIFGARLLFKRDWEDCVAIGFCCLFSNSVLLGLPITERAYGADALAGNFAIVAFHAPFCYGLGITVMEVVRNRGETGLTMLRNVGRAMFRNALVIGILAGFAVNLSGLILPTVVEDALSLIVRAALPAALFALGGVLIQYRPEGDMKAIAMVCAVALLVHPALVWTFGSALSLPTDAFRSGVLTAAMAPGFNAYIFANMYGRARRVAASSVLIATAVSILSVWFWLGALP
ncbi:AEC family transporter [Sulfitobacter mediterraneus]|uniref:AEC family transporter n=1 Tax=Sulfitobacter mediterraneus TaxID=83219 RepID=UPI0013C41017|nr:AEC family transporter [Sulfitobacter mediterraneus]